MKKGEEESAGPAEDVGCGWSDEELATLVLKVRPDLYRAFHRCSWILIHETGRDQLDIMQEMVEDFLIKHQC
ncbi:MAG: hypothetical protein BM485_04020 [Desulfobulbaceae bacterium DB1]|nr:MAG: hypothetical protein BM485_04020 [Desulfobulbaceae bacterium DB1]